MNDRFSRSCGSCLSGLKLQPLETISAGFFLAAVCWLTFASGRITLTVTSFKVFPAALWLACSWFFMLLARRQNSCCLRRRDWLWLLLTTAFLLAPWLPVLTGHPGYDGYWLLCLKFFYLSALVYLLFLLNSIKRLAAFAFLFPSLLLIASLAGILEYLGLIFVVENWEHNTVAVFFKNPNIYAAFLLVCLPVSFGCLRLQQGRVLMIFTALACLLGLFNLFLAGSRAALLALCFILLAAVVFYIRGQQQQQQRKRFIKWFLLFCCVLLLLLLVFFYLNQQFFFKFINSFRIREARVLFYRTALQIWTNSPFTIIRGSGPGAFFAHYSAFRPADFRLLGSDRGSQHAHNLILEILCESGVIGLLLFLAMAGLLAYYTLRLLRKLTFPPGLKPLLTGFLLALAALCCDGMFSTNLQEPPVEMLFYLTAGILWCFIRLEPGPAKRLVSRRFNLPLMQCTIVVLLLLIPVCLGLGRRFFCEYNLLQGLQAADPPARELWLLKAAALADGGVFPPYYLAEHYLKQRDFSAFGEQITVVEKRIVNFAGSNTFRVLALLAQQRFYEAERLLVRYFNRIDQYDREAAVMLIYLSLRLQKDGADWLRTFMEMDFNLNNDPDMRFVYRETAPTVQLTQVGAITQFVIGRQGLTTLLDSLGTYAAFDYVLFHYQLRFLLGELYLRAGLYRPARLHFQAAYDLIRELAAAGNAGGLEAQFGYTTAILKQLLEAAIDSYQGQQDYLLRIALLKAYLQRFPLQQQRYTELMALYSELSMFKAAKVWSLRFGQALQAEEETPVTDN